MARDDLGPDDFREWIRYLRWVAAYLERVIQGTQPGIPHGAPALPLETPVRQLRIKERADGSWSVSGLGRAFTLPPLLGLLFALLAAGEADGEAGVVRAKTRRELRERLAQQRGRPVTPGALAQLLSRLRAKLELHDRGSLLEYCAAVYCDEIRVAPEGYRLLVSPDVGRTVDAELIRRLKERAQKKLSASSPGDAPGPRVEP